MAHLTDHLLSRIAERAKNPQSRYTTARDDEGRVELPIEEIQRADEEQMGQIIATSYAREGKFLSTEQLEHHLQEYRASQAQVWHSMEEVRQSWGLSPFTTLSFSETLGASSKPPGANPLKPAPSEQDWDKLVQLTGYSVPHDLRTLYSIANGGFGPGLEGLFSIDLIEANCRDFRRRGPDFCETIAYPDYLLPIAGEMLDYHYDLETGRIISSDQDWREKGLKPDQAYQIAFESLSEMMEDWLARS